jgi:hypothetical protein
VAEPAGHPGDGDTPGEVATWPTTKNLGLTDGTRQIFEELLRQGEQLTGDSGHVSAGPGASESLPQQAPEADGEGLSNRPRA